MAQFPVGNTTDSAIVFPFTAIDLTSAIDVIPNQWGLLGDMAMFEEDGVDTTVIEINYRDGFINILASAERGTIPNVASGDDEAAVFLKIPHFPDVDVITPKDLENRWAFVRGDNVPRRRRTIEDEVMRRLAKIALRHDLTLEYLRMGALKGRIYDGKGKLLVDLFQTFGITQQVFTFKFSDPNFAVQQFTYQVARQIELNLHGDVANGIDALVSPEFFDQLTSHPKVQQFFLNWNSNVVGDNRKGFRVGALNFIEYNAQVPSAPLPGILQQQWQEANAFTSAATAASGTTLTFAANAIPAWLQVGWSVADYTTPAAIPAGTTVTAIGATTVTISQGAGTGGVLSGDEIIFTPPNITRFIEAGAGYAFPSGTRDTFRTYFGPPYTVQNISQVGMKRFVSPKILDHGRGIEFFSESNPLPICRRPNTLVKLQMA